MELRRVIQLAVRCAVFLLAGCVLSIVIAWMFSVRVQMAEVVWTTTRIGVAQSGGAHWAMMIEEGFGATELKLKAPGDAETSSFIVAAMQKLALEAQQTSVEAAKNEHFPEWLPSRVVAEGTDGRWVTVRSVGWPARSMYWIQTMHTGGPTTRFGSTHSLRAGKADVPIGVRWVGMAANTVVYALASWIAWRSSRWAIRGIVQRRRRTRGQCEGCGYPRGEGGMCPECGTTEG